MIRHLKNFNELVLYASISCGLAFFARVNPTFYYPVLLLRIAVLAYCFYVIYNIEANKIFGILLGSSVFLGLIGGYWDLIELHLRFNQSKILSNAVLIIAAPFIFSGLWLQWHQGKGYGR
jgi:hypothetical protein